MRQRGLADVSHFFFDAPATPPHVPQPTGVTAGPTVIYIVSAAEAVPGAVAAVGLAVGLVADGRTVFLADAVARPFGVTFALGLSGVHHSAMVSPSGPNLHVLTVPLAGPALPEFYLDSAELRRIRGAFLQSDVACILIGPQEACSVCDVLQPDGVVVLAGDTEAYAQEELYQVVKGLIARVPRLDVGVVGLGTLARPAALFQEALERFLGRRAVQLGRMAVSPRLQGAFLAGALLDSTRHELGPMFQPIAARAAAAWLGTRDRNAPRSSPGALSSPVPPV